MPVTVTMTVTPAWAALLALLFVALSLRVVLMRRRTGVAIGDGGSQALLRRQRAHGNFAEYVPLALLLMLMAELQGTPGWALHGLGLALLAGRVAHAAGVSREPEPLPLRVTGMALTFAALTGGALANLALAWTGP